MIDVVINKVVDEIFSHALHHNEFIRENSVKILATLIDDPLKQRYGRKCQNGNSCQFCVPVDGTVQTGLASRKPRSMIIEI